MLSRATLKMAMCPCVISAQKHSSNKKGRVPFGVAARFSKLCALLAVQFTRARFAGPLPPKEEAVRKGEVSISDTHGAV